MLRSKRIVAFVKLDMISAALKDFDNIAMALKKNCFIDMKDSKDEKILKYICCMA
jgi:hypothetical protein